MACESVNCVYMINVSKGFAEPEFFVQQYKQIFKRGETTMNNFTNRLKTLLALICLTLFCSSIAQAEEITLETLIDRQKVQDLITRYYFNFGGTPESFANFYVENGELILIGQSYKGRAAITKAYTFPDSESPKNFSFNSLISNLLITVKGDTARAQLVWTENVMQKERGQIDLKAQGREYSTFVKKNGKWMYLTREIKGGTEPPEGWGK